jgi:hypothetical protein
MEIGAKAEQIVLEDEIAYLQRCGKQELSEQVRNVSANPMLGFDVLSWELDGKQKQIEVKAIREGASKSFFISANELKKSQELANYYIYCVEINEQGRQRILRLEKPDLSDPNLFKMECVMHRITFN